MIHLIKLMEKKSEIENNKVLNTKTDKKKGQTNQTNRFLFFVKSLFFMFLIVTVLARLNAYSLSDGERIPLGTNVSQFADWSTQIVFVDVKKQSRQWVTTAPYWYEGLPYDTGYLEQIPQDENGYPLELPYTTEGEEHPQIVKTLFFRDINGAYPSGHYTVLYDGEGEIAFNFWGDNRIISEEPGRIVIDVEPSNAGFEMSIRRSQFGNHIRNIRVIMPGFEDTYEEQVLNPKFLELLEGFSAIRFMQMLKINGTPTQTTWENRTVPTYHTQTKESGVAMEYIIEIANRADKDAWINIHHMADDTYVRNTAKMLYENLDPSLKVYVEYSNEIWNTAYDYPQTQWVRQQACADPETFVPFLGDPEFDWGNPGCEDLSAGLRYQVRRSAQVFKIFQEEFGAQSDRLIEVIATIPTIFRDSWITDVIFESLNDSVLNPHGIEVDGVAIGAYVGNNIGDNIVDNGELGTITIDGVLDRLEAEVHNEFSQNIAAISSQLTRYGVKMFAYEGGQHLVGVTHMHNSELNELLSEANRHPRMGAIYKDLFTIWYDNGGDDFINYVLVRKNSAYGNFGVVEDLEQDLSLAYKYQALMEISALLKNNKPAYPINLTVTPSVNDNGVHLEWESFLDDTFETAGYKVFQDGVMIGHTSGDTSFHRSWLQLGQTYTYSVIAFDGDGNLSESSNVVSLMPGDSEAPGTAQGLTGTPTPEDNGVTLSWQPSTDNVSVEGYKVFQDGIMIGHTTGETSFHISWLQPGQIYIYSVITYDGAGNLSEPSNSIEFSF